MLAARTSEAIGRAPDRRTGTVVSFVSERLTVSVAGGDPEEVGYLDSYQPEPGDVVILILQRSTWVCIGRIANPTSPFAAPQQNGQQVTASGQVSNSAVYVNIPGLSFQITKRRTLSRVYGQVAGSAYANVAGGVVEFSAQINGVDHGLATFYFNATGQHHAVSGFRYLSGIPKGTYTVQGRFRLASGGGQITLDNNDRVSLMCAEVN